jgi:hypothetical protein
MKFPLCAGGAVETVMTSAPGAQLPKPEAPLLLAVTVLLVVTVVLAVDVLVITAVLVTTAVLVALVVPTCVDDDAVVADVTADEVPDDEVLADALDAPLAVDPVLDPVDPPVAVVLADVARVVAAASPADTHIPAAHIAPGLHVELP